MPSMKDIRKKVSSTKNTQQITKAMKMVSAAKLRKAQHAITNSRPYAYKIHSLISRLAHSGAHAHPLMAKVEVPKKLLMVVITSDRGLCGAFNSNILKQTERFYKENQSRYEEINFIFIGRRGADYFKKRNAVIKETVVNLAHDIRYELAARVSNLVATEFLSGSYDEVILVYNEFKSAISQKVIAETLLPIQPLSKDQKSFADEADIVASQDINNVAANYTYEPGAPLILAELLPKHFAMQIYRVMLESISSEHGARMTAMDSATRNAGQMIRKLTLTYNKLRQAAITKELMEIVSGAEALK